MGKQNKIKLLSVVTQWISLKVFLVSFALCGNTPVWALSRSLFGVPVMVTETPEMQFAQRGKRKLF